MDLVLRARWQNLHTDGRMLVWMQHHICFVNATPEMLSTGGLDPPESFIKALATVAALKPAQEIKRYSRATTIPSGLFTVSSQHIYTNKTARRFFRELLGFMH
jgi:hypothetical protein